MVGIGETYMNGDLISHRYYPWSCPSALTLLNLITNRGPPSYKRIFENDGGECTSFYTIVNVHVKCICIYYAYIYMYVLDVVTRNSSCLGVTVRAEFLSV